MVIDSIIFDVDGTLWDATDVVADAWNTAIRDNTTLSLTINGPILKNLFGKTLDEIAVIIFKDEHRASATDETLESSIVFKSSYSSSHCIAHISSMLKPFTLEAKLLGLSLLPLQSGQGFSSRRYIIFFTEASLI